MSDKMLLSKILDKIKFSKSRNQITYSEFIFLDKYWPDFSCEDVDNCIAEYNNRNRRKGK